MKAKLLILLAFIVVFGAGAVVGRVPAPPANKPSHHGRSMLSEQLNLTPEQQKQMQAIWSEVMPPPGPGPGPATGPGRGPFDRRRELQKERDEAIKSLLTDAQKSKFEAINQQYEQKVAELNAQRAKAFQDAVERTKKILDDTQRAKYEEFLKSRPEGGRHGRGEGGPREGHRSTTNPAQS